MPHYLDLTIDGESLRFGPIVNDNHERDIYTDPRIQKKANYWCRSFNSMPRVTFELVEVIEMRVADAIEVDIFDVLKTTDKQYNNWTELF